MRWASPELLALLWMIPVLLGAVALAERRRAAVERRLGDPARIRERAEAPNAGSRWLRHALVLLAASLAALGLARPQAGYRLVTTTSRGVDLVVALDLSHSMEARDVRPNRLRAAKREVLSLLSSLEGSAIGVVAFAGDARVLSPLTTDREGLQSVIEPAEPEDLSAPGSDLGAAMRLAALLLRRPGERPRALLLVSDGENLEGDPRAPLAAARSAGARIFTLGLGTPQGATIPIIDSTGATVGQRRDPSGQIVRSRLDEGLLRDLARRGGGRYERGDGTGRAALKLADAMRSEGGVEARGQTVRAYDERYPLFAAAAGLLLVLERLVPRRRRRPLLAALVIVLAWPLPAQASYEWGGPARRGVRELKKGEAEAAVRSLAEARAERPASAAIRYDQALAYGKLGRGDSARVAYEDALRLRGPNARSAAAYNLGNGALRGNRLEEAIARYRASLRADPKRIDAKRNLEEAIRRARQSKPPPTPPRSGGGGGSTGPSGPGAGGGGGGGPQPSAPQDEGDQPKPRAAGGPIPNRAEAELWLKALESERRSERSREKRQGEIQERSDRDW